jgi:hypothetical protein
VETEIQENIVILRHRPQDPESTPWILWPKLALNVLKGHRMTKQDEACSLIYEANNSLDSRFRGNDVIAKLLHYFVIPMNRDPGKYCHPAAPTAGSRNRGRCLYYLLVMIIVLLFPCLLPAEEHKNIVIKFEQDLLSIKAQDADTEEVLRTLSKQCGLEIVVHGDPFPTKTVTAQIENLPFKKAIAGLMRTCNIKNYMMDLRSDEKTGAAKLVKLDLFLGGGGTRSLTARAESPPVSPAPEAPAEVPKEEPSAMQRTQTQATAIQGSGKLLNKTSFADDSSFRWDGSAPIDFPKFEGQLPFDKSKHRWEPAATTFATKTMDIVPPAVRDIVSDMLIKACDDIAQERGEETVTPETTAAALQNIGKSFNLPPTVMNIIPTAAEDLEGQKVPLEKEDLKKEHQ